MFLAFLLLGTALTISAVAIYYSVAGLAAIFAAAFWPIVIMGTTLEVAKLVAASWLKMYWEEAPRLLKWYLTVSVVILMLITSMGIFGFLSKAHSDQSLVSGDVQSKISLIDEKIKIERENIANAQQVIKQMDAAVNGVMSTGDQEVKLRDGSTRINSAAERSLQIRRSQARDRAKLTSEIEAAQARIIKLQEEAAPIRAEVRKVEAEVGPIKYIAKFIYGDNPDANILEKAVTWVIVLIIFVFDPLAVLMLLASQWTFAQLKAMKNDDRNQPDPESNNPIPTTDQTDSDQDGTWQHTNTQSDTGDNLPLRSEGADDTEQQPDHRPTSIDNKVVDYQILDEYIEDDYIDSVPIAESHPLTLTEEHIKQIRDAAKQHELNKKITQQADLYDAEVTYDWDGGENLYSKTYVQHLISQLQDQKISINNLNQEEINEIIAELEFQQKNKDNNPA